MTTSTLYVIVLVHSDLHGRMTSAQLAGPEHKYHDLDLATKVCKRLKRQEGHDFTVLSVDQARQYGCRC